MRRGETSTRIDGRYFALREVITSPYPLVEFGTLVTREPDYGLSSRAVTRTSETEPRYIRMRKFRYSNFLIVAANVVKLMADYVITASGNSNLLRPSVLCLGNRGATT